MADWPVLGGQRFEQAGVEVAGSDLKDVAAGSPENTKGSVVELIASTAFDAGWVVPLLMWANAVHLTDFLIGPDGSEEVLIPDFLSLSAIGGAQVGGQVPIPLHVPAGSRLSAKTQSSWDSNIQRTGLMLVGQGSSPSSPLGRVAAIGANTSTSRGTPVSNQASYEKSSWVALSPTVPFDAKWLVVFASPYASYDFLLDIGIGGVGSEEVLIPDLWIHGYYSGLRVAPCFSLPAQIPSGTTLSARIMSWNYTVTLDVACYVIG